MAKFKTALFCPYCGRDQKDPIPHKPESTQSLKYRYQGVQCCYNCGNAYVVEKRFVAVYASARVEE